ncbi:MAG: regulatory protein [Candidatus Endobugula sp.]|jgi:regulatory protein
MMTSAAYTSTFMSFDNSCNHSSSRSDDVKAIKVSALRYLARREYSRVELYRKLSQKFSAIDAIQAVLDELKEQGYQSDTRFTESFIRAKVNAGNGPFKIKIELREKGICESTALSAFDRQSIDWLVLAENVKHKRFGSELIEALPLTELAKQVRYLKNKGFYQEHIDQVIKSKPSF